MAIWSRALSHEELTAIYNAGLNGYSLLTLMGPAVSCSGNQTVECGLAAAVAVDVGNPPL